MIHVCQYTEKVKRRSVFFGTQFCLPFRRTRWDFDLSGKSQPRLMFTAFRSLTMLMWAVIGILAIVRAGFAQTPTLYVQTGHEGPMNSIVL